jgi:hypothetical protein
MQFPPKLVVFIFNAPRKTLKRFFPPLGHLLVVGPCLFVAGCQRTDSLPSSIAAEPLVAREFSDVQPDPPEQGFSPNGERESRELMVAFHSPSDPAEFARKHQLALVRIFRSDPDMAVFDAGSIEAARTAKQAFASDPAVRAVYFNPPTLNIRSSPINP